MVFCTERIIFSS